MEQKYIIKYDNTPIKAPQTELTDSLEVEAIHLCDYYRFAPSFNFMGEKHDFYEFFYVVQGKILVKTDLGVIEMKEKEYIIVPPNIFHSMVPNGTFTSSYNVSFSAKNLDEDICMKVNEIDRLEKQYLDQLFLNYRGNVAFDGYVKTMYNSEDQFGYLQIIKNTLELMLISFSRKHYSKMNRDAVPQDKTDALFMIIRKYISDNYEKKIDLETMAADLNYSTGYICRIFKKNVHTTFLDYLNKFRIQKAIELFANTGNDSITAVGYSVGFTDPYYFSRLFKKLTGMTPKQYLKYTQKTHMANTYFVLNDKFLY